MGNKIGNVTSLDFNPNQWKITDKENPLTQNKGNFKVLENIKTGELIDEYILFWITEEDFRFYLDSYHWRRQEYNIVSSRYIVEEHTEQFCSRSYGAKVYIEHIPTRLSDVTDIPYPDNLYVALAVLEGYQKLYENVHHYFPISEDQICVDQEGIVKVWVNSDLSKNYPEPDETASQNKDEAHMVQELLNIIWQNTDQQSEPQSFREFFSKKKGKKRVGFDEAKVLVNEYAKNVSCQIPEKFNSILQMIEESEYPEENQLNKESDHGLNDEPHSQYDSNQKYQNTAGYQHGLYQQYESDEVYRQDQFQGDQGQNQNQYQNMYYGQPMAQRTVYENRQPFYHKAPITLPQYNMPPIPHPVNQLFVPREIGPQYGPIISIPPIIKPNVNCFNAHAQTMRQQVYPYAVYPQNYHDRPFQSYPVHVQKTVLRNQAYQNQSSLNSPQKTLDLFPNEISQSKPHPSLTIRHTQNEQIFQTQQQNLQRYEANNAVDRSFQLAKQSSLNNIQIFKLKVNKSHIHEPGQMIQASYSKNSQDQGFNSKALEIQNSQVSEVLERGDRNNEILQYTREELLDTKYYTINNEVELDEEIAADLKKMIMAL